MNHSPGVWAISVRSRNAELLEEELAAGPHRLEIRKDGVLVRSAFSPFKADEFVVGAGQEGWEDLRDKNLLFYLTKN